MNPLTRLFSWLRSLISSPVPPVPRRTYPREACPVCGKTVAMTSKGLWPYTCQPVEKDEAAS